jgi:hypothetical protein
MHGLSEAPSLMLGSATSAMMKKRDREIETPEGKLDPCTTAKTRANVRSRAHPRFSRIGGCAADCHSRPFPSSTSCSPPSAFVFLSLRGREFFQDIHIIMEKLPPSVTETGVLSATYPGHAHSPKTIRTGERRKKMGRSLGTRRTTTPLSLAPPPRPGYSTAPP